MSKHLAQYSLPAKKSHTIRVFLSSTFKDMEMERSELVKLFKGLQVKAAIRGVTISLIDLRWGITEDDAKNSKVIEICLKEIINSRPFFIGMLGDRYGWCPQKEDLSQTICENLDYNWIENDIKNHHSVTEMEMQFGVLRNPNPLHAYFYIKQQSNEISYADDELIKLNQLKECIIQQKRYPVCKYTTPQQLCDFVEKDFTELLEKEYPDIITVENNQELQEQLIRDELLLNYHPITDAEHTFNQFINDAQQSCLVVTGECGVGKSALLAYWSEVVNEGTQWLPIYHQLDSTVLATYPEMLVKSLTNKCKRALDDQCSDHTILFQTNVKDQKISLIDKIKKSFSFFSNPLRKFTENTRRNIAELEEDFHSFQYFNQLWDALSKTNQSVIIFIDDISQLNPDGASLYSMFSNLPSNVKVVLSFSATSTAYEPFVQNGSLHYQLHGFLPTDVLAFTKRYLSFYAKALSSQQENVISSWLLASQPRCLKVLLDELISFGQYEVLDKCIEDYCKNSQTPIFYDSVLRRLAKDYGYDKITKTLLLLTLTSEGLTEDEVKNMGGINQLLWAQLRVELRSWLTMKSGRYCISDAQMKESIYHCFAQDECMVHNLRNQIIIDFIDDPVLLHPLSFADYNHRMKQFCYHDSYRYIVEIAFQSYNMKNWDFLKDWISNPEFFEVLYRSNRPLLINSWKEIMNNNSTITPEIYAKLSFDKIDPYLIPVIANDMAAMLSTTFHYTNAAIDLGNKAMSKTTVPTIAKSVMTMNNGCRFANDNQYDKACDCFLEALAMQERIIPTPNKEIANTCANLGKAYYYSKNYNDAITFLNRAIDYHTDHTDEDSQEEKIGLLDYVAYCYYHKDENEHAAKLFKEIALMHEQKEGRLSRNVTKCLRMQGKSLYYAGQYQESWDAVNQALEIAITIKDEKQISACHKQLYELCDVFRMEKKKMGDESSAGLWFNESLLHDKFFNKSPRLDSVNVPYEALRHDTMHQYYNNKDYDAVIRIATTLDMQDYDTAPNASCLIYYLKAQALTKQENFEMAKKAFADELELWKKYFGWDKDDTIMACQNLGVMHAMCDEPQEAIARLQEAYSHEVERNGINSDTAKNIQQKIAIISQ